MSYTIQTGSSKRIDLPSNLLINESLIETVHITSDVDIAVYVTQTNGDYFDTFLALPVTALGTEYIVPHVHTIVVMATQPQTKVDIIFSNGTSQQHLFNRFEVYTTFLPMQFGILVGVLSDKAVSVFSGVYCYVIGICGFSTLQQTSYDRWDRQFIVNLVDKIDFFTDIYKFTPTEMHPCLPVFYSRTCNATQGSFISNASDPDQNTVVILEENVLQVYIMARSLAGALLNVPGVSQYLDDYSFFIPDLYSTANNFINITVLKTQTRNLRLDGDVLENPIATYDVPGRFDKYTVLVYRISTGFHHMNDIQGVPFGLICSGYDGDYYMYPAGISFNGKV